MPSGPSNNVDEQKVEQSTSFSGELTLTDDFYSAPDSQVNSSNTAEQIESDEDAVVVSISPSITPSILQNQEAILAQGIASPTSIRIDKDAEIMERVTPPPSLANVDARDVELVTVAVENLTASAAQKVLPEEKPSSAQTFTQDTKKRGKFASLFYTCIENLCSKKHKNQGNDATPVNPNKRCKF